MPKCYISPIWAATPSNLTAISFLMWGSLPDVISCARFYLYHLSSFFGVLPQTSSFPIDSIGELYNC